MKQIAFAAGQLIFYPEGLHESERIFGGCDSFTDCWLG
jgi:hypothetical protein